VVTKIDLAPDEVYQKVLAVLKKICDSKEVKKSPMFVDENTDPAFLAKAMPDKMICPIFSVSNVTGAGIDKFKGFLSNLRSRVKDSGQFGLPTDPVEFLIDGFYQVKGVGLVVAGTLLSGTVKPGENLLLGPNKTGQFDIVKVNTIHHKRMDAEIALAG